MYCCTAPAVSPFHVSLLSAFFLHSTSPCCQPSSSTPRLPVVSLLPPLVTNVLPFYISLRSSLSKLQSTPFPTAGCFITSVFFHQSKIKKILPACGIPPPFIEDILALSMHQIHGKQLMKLYQDTNLVHNFQHV